MHHLVGMRSLILRHNETRQRFERRAKSADERASKAVKERDEAREELTRLRDLLSKEREHSALVLKEKEGALQKEIKLVSDLKASLSRAEAESRKAEGLRLKEEERASAAAREVVVERERAAAAEGRELAAKKEAENFEQREKAAEEKASAAECRAKEAEARSARAVEEYKSSSAFKDELADFSIEAYSLGFDYCKGMVREKFPDLNLLTIVADGGVGEPAEGPEGATAEGGEEGRVEAAPAPSFQLIPAAPPEIEPAAVVIQPSAAVAEVRLAVEADGDEVVEVPPPSAPSSSSKEAASGAE